MYIKNESDLSYLSHILLKHAQLQALVEAEFTVLPRPLYLMVTLPTKNRQMSHQSAGQVVSDSETGERESYLHYLVQTSHDAVRGGREVWFGRRVVRVCRWAMLENLQ